MPHSSAPQALEGPVGKACSNALPAGEVAHNRLAQAPGEGAPGKAGRSAMGGSQEWRMGLRTGGKPAAAAPAAAGRPRAWF